ncbi:MAG: LysE family translocator [Alphaproteobacteria bacterium]|nr:LysE family translocator [Alphaproteobacteria bacterium]
MIPVDLWPLWKGVGIGLAVAIPVGPVGLLCIRRSLARGWLSGFLSGLGAAVADGFYAGAAAFGLTAITAWLVASQGWIAPVGGALLLWLGWQIARAQPGEGRGATETAGLTADFASTFAVTMTNPATILSFIALFAGFGLAAGEGGYGAATLLTLGTVLGSALWWLILSKTAGWARRYATAERLVWVNRAAGMVIMAFGAWGLATAIR